MLGHKLQQGEKGGSIFGIFPVGEGPKEGRNPFFFKRSSHCLPVERGYIVIGDNDCRSGGNDPADVTAGVFQKIFPYNNLIAAGGGDGDNAGLPLAEVPIAYTYLHSSQAIWEASLALLNTR